MTRLRFYALTLIALEACAWTAVALAGTTRHAFAMLHSGPLAAGWFGSTWHFEPIARIVIAIAALGAIAMYALRPCFASAVDTILGLTFWFGVGVARVLGQ